MAKKIFLPGVFFGKVLSRLYLIITLIIVVFPLLWMFSLSFRKVGELTLSRFLIIPVNIETTNYAKGMEYAADLGLPITMLFKNSFIVTKFLIKPIYNQIIYKRFIF